MDIKDDRQFYDRSAFKCAVDWSDLRITKLIGDCGRFDFEQFMEHSSILDAVVSNANDIIAYLISKDVPMYDKDQNYYHLGCFLTLWLQFE